MRPYLRYILNKMCSYVGIRFVDIISYNDSWINPITRRVESKVVADGWQSTHSWTIKQENDFEKWLIDYLYENTKARNEMLKYPVKNKKCIRRAVECFLLDYGWKLKDSEGDSGI